MFFFGWKEVHRISFFGARYKQLDRRFSAVGANGCQGALWSEELGGKGLRGAIGGKRTLEPRDSPSSGHRLPTLLRRLQCGMLISKFTLVLLFIIRLFLS